MTLELHSILKRIDETALNDILGSDVFGIIRAFNYYEKFSDIKNKFLENFDYYSLLKNKHSREIIIDLFRDKEIQKINDHLSIPNINNPYTTLKQYLDKQRNLNNFLKFFGIMPKSKEHIQREDEETVYPFYSLFPYQKNLLQNAWSLLEKGEKKFVIHMPTGSGKTRTIMNLICEKLRKIKSGLFIWVAYSEELCEQAIEEFKNAWNYLGDRTVKVYRLWGSSKLKFNKNDYVDGFAVVSFTKLWDLYQQRIENIVTLGTLSKMLIVDEAHQSVAETYKEMLKTLFVLNTEEKILIGLSATPGRSYDNIEADLELSDFFDNNKISLKAPNNERIIDYLTSEGYLSEVEYRSLFYEKGFELTPKDIQELSEKIDIPNSLLKNISQIKLRNIKIIDEVFNLVFKKGHKRILVFAATVENSNLLANALNILGVKAFSVTSGTDSKERNKILNLYKSNNEDPIILINYGVLTTGFDAPLTSAVIIARPTKSLILYSQMVGRAIRGEKAGGTKKAEVITVVDFDLPGFRDLQEAFSYWDDVYK